MKKSINRILCLVIITLFIFTINEKITAQQPGEITCIPDYWEVEFECGVYTRKSDQCPPYQMGDPYCQFEVDYCWRVIRDGNGEILYRDIMINSYSLCATIDEINYIPCDEQSTPCPCPPTDEAFRQKMLIILWQHHADDFELDFTNLNPQEERCYQGFRVLYANCTHQGLSGGIWREFCDGDICCLNIYEVCLKNECQPNTTCYNIVMYARETNTIINQFQPCPWVPAGQCGASLCNLFSWSNIPAHTVYDDLGHVIPPVLLKSNEFNDYDSERNFMVFIKDNTIQIELFQTLNSKEANQSTTFNLYDIIGNKVLTYTLSDISAIEQINVSHLSQGVYHYSIMSNGILLQNGKLIKVKGE